MGNGDSAKSGVWLHHVPVPHVLPPEIDVVRIEEIKRLFDFVGLRLPFLESVHIQTAVIETLFDDKPWVAPFGYGILQGRGEDQSSLVVHLGNVFAYESDHNNSYTQMQMYENILHFLPFSSIFFHIFAKMMIGSLQIHKYSGAGNDFIVIDARRELVCGQSEAVRFCTEYCADGLMLLSEGSDGADFRMEFFNPDGSGGMMCGNGGRCIVAFAEDLGVAPAGEEYVFDAPDGRHCAKILSRDGVKRNVRLQMRDPFGFRECQDGYFINTGTRHLVRFISDVEAVDVAAEGPVLRHLPEFAPEGVNVDFVQVCDDGSMKVRTFEKGVEGETLACGTGIVASACVARKLSFVSGPAVTVQARIDTLLVEFTPDSIYLTGPALRCF